MSVFLRTYTDLLNKLPKNTALFLFSETLFSEIQDTKFRTNTKVVIFDIHLMTSKICYF